MHILDPHKRLARLISILALLAILAAPATQADTGEFVPAKVTDISDRAYEKAVSHLIDNAKSSIVISMYTVTLGTSGRNPMSLLIGDVLEARERGVAVTLYLNTCFKDQESPASRLAADAELKRLKDAGCTVVLFPSNRRLHDKLIIVDGRWVVEGSTNWSISALRQNYESATLIDSPGLADVKLKRLAIRLDSLDAAKPSARKPFYADELSGGADIPEILLTDKRYIPRMIQRKDERSMVTCLLLYAHSAKAGDKEFFVDLESLALSLGLPSSATDADLRRQTIRALRKLDANYGLVKAEFFNANNARVCLASLGGPSFRVPPGALEGGLTARSIFMALARAYFAAQGEDIDKLSNTDIAERLHVKRDFVNDARH